MKAVDPALAPRRRFLCVRLAGWPIQRRGALGAPTGRPFVLFEAAARGVRVTACSAAAAALGIVPGFPLEEAVSLAGAENPLAVAAADPAADRAELGFLADECQRFTPLVCLEDAEFPEAILLDTTGCGPAFGGEDALVERVRAHFRERGFFARVAAADTLGAAWAFARHDAPSADELPVALLRIPAGAAEILAELGVRTVGQLRALPRDRLPERFGPAVLGRLDQFSGASPEPLVPRRVAAAPSRHKAFEPPVEHDGVLQGWVERLLERLLGDLETGHGILRLDCALERAGRPPAEPCVELRQPTADFGRLRQLLRLQWERLRDLGPVAGLRLTATATRPLEFRQTDLFGDADDRAAAAETDALIERLANRLGRRAVLRVRIDEDPEPERRFAAEPLLDSPTATTAEANGEAAEEDRERPIRRLARPAPLTMEETVEGRMAFRWGGERHVILNFSGPERIETGWWRRTEADRDSHQVETAAGRRFWICRRNDGRWFLTGCFD